MNEEKMKNITDGMMNVFDTYIIDIDNHIRDARDLIYRQDNMIEALEYAKNKAKATRTIMVEHQSAIYQQEEAVK